MQKVLTTVISMMFLFGSNGLLAADIVIEDAWVREAPPNAKILAAYMTINNSGEEKDSLLSVDSNCCKKIEIHQSVVKDGQAKMIQRKSLLIPAEANINLEPGGLHLMLINPRKFHRNKMREGNEVEMTFNFATHEAITIKAKIKKVTGADPHAHH